MTTYQEQVTLNQELENFLKDFPPDQMYHRLHIIEAFAKGQESGREIARRNFADRHALDVLEATKRDRLQSDRIQELEEELELTRGETGIKKGAVNAFAILLLCLCIYYIFKKIISL